MTRLSRHPELWGWEGLTKPAGAWAAGQESVGKRDNTDDPDSHPISPHPCLGIAIGGN